MTKHKTTKHQSDAEPAEVEAVEAGEPVAAQPPDTTVLSEKSAVADRPGADPVNFTRVEVSDEEKEFEGLSVDERNERTHGVAFAAVPPVVQLDASDDAEVERRQELRLKRPRQEVQAARERSQAPGFVPAESAESIAFNKLKADVAKEVRAEVLAEKVAVGQPLLPGGPDPETTPVREPEDK